jgi:hypothetical protein
VSRRHERTAPGAADSEREAFEEKESSRQRSSRTASPAIDDEEEGDRAAATRPRAFIVDRQHQTEADVCNSSDGRSDHRWHSHAHLRGRSGRRLRHLVSEQRGLPGPQHRALPTKEDDDEEGNHRSSPGAADSEREAFEEKVSSKR